MTSEQSDEDELVNVTQRDLMWQVIEKRWFKGRKDELVRLVRKHDEILRKGEPGTLLDVAVERFKGSLTAG
jgi:hypothetical protein